MLAEKQYGIPAFLSGLELLETGERRIRATTPQTLALAAKLRGVQSVGLYVAKTRGTELTFSIEGSHLICAEISKSLIELGEDEAKLWIAGAPIRFERPLPVRFVIGRFAGFCLGSGAVSRDGRVYPQVPKVRRVLEE